MMILWYITFEPILPNVLANIFIRTSSFKSSRIFLNYTCDSDFCRICIVKINIFSTTTNQFI